MTCESELKALRKAIATQHEAMVDTPELYIHNPVFDEQAKQYELISAKYNDLYEDILPDLDKMSEEYQEVRRRGRLATFFSR